jgi:hypothetical protein
LLLTSVLSDCGCPLRLLPLCYDSLAAELGRLASEPAPMGHQLWTSPLTGYRRRGTRYAELREAVGRAITAASIFEPLMACPAAAPSAEMKRVLEARDFDIAGVRDAENGPLLGIVVRNEMQAGTVRDWLRPVPSERIIADSTGIADLLGVLLGSEYSLVVAGHRLDGIVTRADLNKPPVRVYLFGLVSLLEMHLNFWIGVEYPDALWKARLSAKRLQDAEHILDERRKRNEATTLEECLQFCDKRDLVIDSPALRKLSLDGKTKTHRLLRRAEDLRNDLAHSQASLASTQPWPELLEVVHELQALVERSDELVEEFAASHATMPSISW